MSSQADVRDSTDPSAAFDRPALGPGCPARRRPPRARLWGAGLVGVALIATGCGGSTTKDSAPTSVPVGPTIARGSGGVDVLYAGSLVTLMQQIGPAFQAATGYSLVGYSDGSTALAAQIKGKVRQGDVFVSASPAVNSSLEGQANGNWVSWYVNFSTSPLVIGYNPHSKFAQDFKTMPWYQVLTQPGLLLGRTDPATDPKGVLAVDALDSAATTYNLPALKNLGKTSSNVYPETTLVGRLQAGQLDAGFFYDAEAVPAHILTVPLSGENLSASYTMTVLNGAPHQAGAEAFVQYMLSAAAQAILKNDGFLVTTPPTASGSGVPADIQATISSL